MTYLQKQTIDGVTFIPDKAICSDGASEAACAHKWQHSLTRLRSARHREAITSRHWLPLSERRK